MKVIGITGGVGSGKSRVLEYLHSKYQAVICQADQVAWKLQEPGQACYKKIVEVFGSDIVLENQYIDRQKLGGIVFSDERKLAVLNQIMHPAVKAYIKDTVREEKSKGTSCFVIEAALLLEDNYAEICDEIWYIYTDEEVRRARLKESRQYSDEKIDRIMKQQLSEEEFRARCPIMIHNSGDFADTCRQIDELMNK